MSWPAGVSQCTVTIGPVLNAAGVEATLNASVTFDTQDRVIVHEETGTSALASPGATAAAQLLTVSVPHVDQPGFVGRDGAPITMWGYSIAVTASWPATKQTQSFVKRVQPLVGQSVIDLDLVADGSFTPPVAGPVAAVSSVAGLTGAVSAAQLSDELSVEASPLPAGGDAGQVLAKTSSADGDAEWVEAPGSDAVSSVVERTPATTAPGWRTEFTGALTSAVRNVVEHTVNGVVLAWQNEWGGFRAKIPPYLDAAFRAIVDEGETPPPGQPAFHINDRRSGVPSPNAWARTWTGRLIRNGVTMSDTYVTTFADPTDDPNFAALPDGTVIVYRSA